MSINNEFHEILHLFVHCCSLDFTISRSTSDIFAELFQKFCDRQISTSTAWNRTKFYLQDTFSVRKNIDTIFI